MAATDLLKDYRAKRDFAKTQEPSGGERAADAQALTFIVQKHDATRLHFDFRIELDGVLKSWAVAKGPSNNPGDKRLAVRVEDHPLDYAMFEGTIPEGEYGGGTVMLWDRGTWEPIGDPQEGLAKGDLKMRINGERMHGEWVLVHMKGRDSHRKNGPDRENWLLIKHHDEFAKDEDTLVGHFTTSVSTSRTMDAIAKGLKPKKASKTPAKAVWHSNADETKPEPKAPVAAKKRVVPTKKQMGALPAFRQPQLATLADAVPEGANWAFEMKYDGYRCLAAVSGPAVTLYTRSGKDWTDKFGVIVEPFTKLTKGSALIDGELCAFNDRGRTDFSTLKDALSDGSPLVFFAFDLLELDGKDLAEQPLSVRKDRLKVLLGRVEKDSPIQYSEHVTGNGQRVFDAIAREGYEGIIAKQLDAPYSSERTRTWLKVKTGKRQEFVIAGWSPSQKRKTFASLLLGTWDEGKLTYRGRVGTGFNAESAQQLQDLLDKNASDDNPFAEIPRAFSRHAHWIKPVLVGEVAFTEFTPDGYLRHPSFLGLRDDKTAREVRLETAAKVSGKAIEVTEVELTDEAGEEAAEHAGVRMTSPHRVVFPDQGVTKAEIVAYYEQVAEHMLPYIAKRPLSLLRCPQGRTKYCFFQKHNTGGFPEQMHSVLIAEKDDNKEDYFYIEDFAGLVAGTQMNVLEWHLWGSRIEDVEKPERIIFDIDPDEGLDFEDVKKAATDIAKGLKELGLESYPLVSGGKGVHVIAPLKPSAEWDEVKAFCKGFAQRMADREPDRFVATMSKAKRKGKMFIDYLRNERGSTAVSPWSIRSRQGAPVAVPVSWDELDGISAANQFTLETAAGRAAMPDPWTGYFKTKQALTKTMFEALKD